MKRLEFERRIKMSKKPVVVDLWAPWCTPCKAMGPALKQISQQYEDRVDVLKINVDESPEVMTKLGVMSIPTLVGFANGNEIVRRTGVQTPGMLDFFFKSTYEQKRPAIMPPAPAARIFRTALGIGCLAAGWYFGQSILLMVLGGLILFSAFYDRCPIMRAILPKIRGWIAKKKENPV